MSIKDHVQTAVQNAIEKGSLFLTADDKTTLIVLVTAKIITTEALTAMVHVLLRKSRRLSYEQHVRSARGFFPRQYDIWPDHTLAPDAFAYALHFGEFNQREERNIGFDHGDTKESFIAQYHVNTLRERIVDKWLTIAPPPEHIWPKEDNDSYCPGCD